MDPNATLRDIQNAIDDHDDCLAEDACRDLWDWLKRSGVTPDWRIWPRATEYYRAYVDRLGRE